MLNAGPLYAKQGTGGVFKAIISKLWGWSGGSCTQFLDDWYVLGKDVWEQMHLGSYKSDEKTAYACFLYPVVWLKLRSVSPVGCNNTTSVPFNFCWASQPISIYCEHNFLNLSALDVSVVCRDVKCQHIQDIGLGRGLNDWGKNQTEMTTVF